MPSSAVKPKAPKASSNKTATKTKKDKPAKSSKPTLKPSGLSEERVVESNSDEETAVPSSTPTPALKLKDKKRKQEKKPEKQNTPVKAPKPLVESSSSSSDDESDVPALRKPEGSSAKVNGVKRKSDESSSDGQSSEVDSEVEAPAKRAKIGMDVDMKDGSSSSEDSDSDEEDDDESTSESEAAQPTEPHVAAPAPPNPLQSIPAAPFEPPEGYTSISVSEPATTSILSAGNLNGKQIWLLSAPSSIPIKSIQELAIEAVQDGSTVLQHKGIDYTLAEDRDCKIEFQSVLLPGRSGFCAAEARVERALKLQQKVDLPNLSKLQADNQTGSTAAGDVARASISEIRPQPKGLRMRYKPPGFGSGNPGLGSDSEGEETVPHGGFQFPKALGVHSVSDGTEERQSVKRNKKKRKTEDVEMVNGDMPPPSSAVALKQKKKEKFEGAPDRPSTSGPVENVGSGSKETEEERRRRKKQLKKERKLKATES